MTQAEAQRTVDFGARELDRLMPGWFRQIDVSRLRIESCHDCLIGQLYGSYSAIAALQLDGPSCGFSVSCENLAIPSWEQVSRDLELLKAVWIDAIARRWVSEMADLPEVEVVH